MSIQHQRITIFQEDDVTPILGSVDLSGNVVEPTCSTDTAAARPYLNRAFELSSSEVNFLEGSSSIGQVTIQVLDKRTVAANQATGWFTALLADVNGKQQLAGHRVLFEQQDENGDYYIVMDGVLGDIMLDEDLVTYTLSVRDIRDRERKMTLFDFNSSGVSILPRGFSYNYGKMAGTDTYLKTEEQGLPAKFYVDPAAGVAGRYGIAIFDSYRVTREREWWNYYVAVSSYVAEWNAPKPTSPITTDDYYKLASTYNKVRGVKVQWRYLSTDPWTDLVDMPFIYESVWARQSFNAFLGRVTLKNGNLIINSDQKGTGYKLSSLNPADLPTNGSNILMRVIIQSPPTDENPLYIEKTFGQLLKDIYDGVYSPPGTLPVRYDEAAMNDLVLNTPIARVKITEVVEDAREWVEANIYKPLGMVPFIGTDGRVRPIKYAIPGPSDPLVQLDDTNIVSGEWKNTTDNVVNKIEFTYQRDTLVLIEQDEPKTNDNTELYEREVRVTYIHPSTEFLGDHVLEYSPETTRSIADATTNGFDTGRTQDELGSILARLRAVEAFDRFAYGAQTISIQAQRSDAGVASLEPGDWVIVASSWMPNFNTQQRGINRIFQVTAINDIDPITRSIELVDGGQNLAVLNQPSITSVSFDDPSKSVSVVVTVVAGAHTRLDYAIAGAQPSANSGLWTYAGRATVGEAIKIANIPLGTTIWVRARSEFEGRRPSAWTTPQNIVIGAQPVIYYADLFIYDNAPPLVKWGRNDDALGVRIKYAVYDRAGSLPTTLTTLGDFDATLLEATLSSIAVQQFKKLYVAIEAYSGWTGSAVTGLLGNTTVAIGERLSNGYIKPEVTIAKSVSTTQATVSLAVLYDPQFRITALRTRTKVGRGGTWSGWTTDSTAPYEAIVNLEVGNTSFVEYEVLALDQDGVEGVLSSGLVDIQGPSVVALVGDVTVLSSTGSTTRVRFTVANPFPNAQDIVIDFVKSTNVPAVAAVSGWVIDEANVTNDLDTTGYIDVDITRPTSGAGVGRVTLFASAVGREVYTDAVDVADVSINFTGNANDLVGTTLAATVVNSSLTSVGTLTELDVTGDANIGGVVYATDFVLVGGGGGVPGGGGEGSGDVVGPASAGDNQLARFNGTTGKLIQASGVVLSDTNVLSGLTEVVATTFTGALIGNASTATQLSAIRDFSITGDATASTVGFNGTGNVVLVSSIAASVIMGKTVTGFVTGANSTVLNTDTLVAALGKIQGQINARLTGNQTITLSGDVTGSGATAITTSIASSVVMAKVLTGYVSGTNTALAAADTVVAAFGKIQGQINARLTANQTITLSGHATGSGTTAIAVTIANNVITNAMIAAGAAIVDTKLATISTAGKVANSATTATETNTANAIVTRDASGGFGAGTIIATLAGNASTATQLQTARTIWGQSFNGTANITGALTVASGGIAVTGNSTIVGTLGGITTLTATSIALSSANAAMLTLTSTLATSGDQYIANFNTNAIGQNSLYRFQNNHATGVASLEVAIGTVGSGPRARLSMNETAALVGTFSNFPLHLIVNSAARWVIDTNYHLLPNVHNTYDLGLTGTRVRDGYFAGTVNAGTFSGSGASLTSLPAAQLTGTVADARLSANVPLLNAVNSFTNGIRFVGDAISDLDTHNTTANRQIVPFSSNFQPLNRPTTANYFSGFSFRHNLAGPWITQVATGSGDAAFHFRLFNATTWGAWRRVLSDTDIGTNVPSPTGTGASGSSWGISITGNSATATSAGIVTTAAQPNITSLGTLTSLALSSANAAMLTLTSTFATSGDQYIANFNTNAIGQNSIYRFQNNHATGVASLEVAIGTVGTGPRARLSMNETAALVGTFSNFPLHLVVNSAPRWIIDTSFHLSPNVHNTYDLGLTGTRMRDGYFAGTVNAGTFSGSGASLTSLPAAQLTGVVADAQISGAYTGITTLTAQALVTTSRIQSAGYSTSYGLTTNVLTTGLNVIMGTSASATWLVTGTSGGVFRGGVQVLDAGGVMRFYVGANYFSAGVGSGALATLNNLDTVTAATFVGALTGNASTATTAGTLAVARNIFGLSFNGGADIGGRVEMRGNTSPADTLMGYSQGIGWNGSVGLLNNLAYVSGNVSAASSYTYIGSATSTGSTTRAGSALLTYANNNTLVWLVAPQSTGAGAVPASLTAMFTVTASGDTTIGGALTMNGALLGATSGSFSLSVATPVLTSSGSLSLSATGANAMTISTNGVIRQTISSAGAVTLSGASLTVNTADTNGLIILGSTAAVSREHNVRLVNSVVTGGVDFVLNAAGTDWGFYDRTVPKWAIRITRGATDTVTIGGNTVTGTLTATSVSASSIITSTLAGNAFAATNAASYANIGGGASSNVKLYLRGTDGSSATAYGVYLVMTSTATTTSGFHAFRSNITTTDAIYTTNEIHGFVADAVIKGAQNQIGTIWGFRTMSTAVTTISGTRGLDIGAISGTTGASGYNYGIVIGSVSGATLGNFALYSNTGVVSLGDNLIVRANGITVTGNSTIAGTLGGVTTLTTSVAVVTPSLSSTGGLAISAGGANEIQLSTNANARLVIGATGDVTSYGWTKIWSSSTNVLNLRDGSGTVDAREWSFRINGGVLDLRSTLDNNTTVTTVISFARAGGVTITGGIFVTGNSTIAGTIGSSYATAGSWITSPTAASQYSTFHRVVMGRSATGYGVIGENITTTTTASVYNYASSNFATLIDFVSGNIILKVAPSGTAGAAATFVSGLTVAATTGIVTVHQGLNVSALTTVTLSTSIGVLINRTGSAINSTIQFQNTSGSIYVGHGAANTFAVRNAADLSVSPWFAVNVTNATFAGTLLSPAGTAAAPAYSFSGDTNSGMYSAAADMVAISTGGVERLLINSSGVTAADFILSSDRRLKDEIEDIQNALEVVMAVSGKTFIMKKDKTRRRRAGFLVQDFQGKFEEPIYESENGELSMAYQQSIPMLWNAVRELSKKVDALREVK